MAAANDVVVQLILKAVDLATKDIDGVHGKLETLKKALTGNEFDRSAEGMQAFGQAVKDSTEPLAAAAKNTLALSAAVTGVASYLAGNAYKAAKDYESALADLAKVLDGGKEEAKAYGEQLNQLALRYSQNGQQLVAAMANFVQAGYSSKEAFDLVEQSVKLMIAGDIEAAQSSEYLVSILKGFKAPASEAASTVDLLNEVSNKYATDVKQLAIGMAGISPIAKQMGFSMSETAGMLTPIIEVYGSGAEAADALKTGLQKLTDTADPVVSALSSIGVSQLDMNGKLRQGKDIFLDVAKAMVGLDDATKQYVIGQLVGIDQAGRMAQVFDNLAGYLGATDTALNSTGSAMKEVEARLETAEAKGKRAEESFRQLSVTLGNTFKPQIAGVIGATGDLAAAFDKAVKSGDLAPLLNVIKPQIAAVENLFSAMAANLDQALDGVDWTPLVDGIKAFSGEFGQAMAALTQGMDLTTVEGLRNLLQALINLMGNFSQYVAGVVDGLEPFLDSLNLLFGAISTNLPTFSNLAGQMTGLATSANQVIPVITSLGSGIFGAIGSVIELAAKIGLLVAGLKLLSAVGIPVGEILGGLVTRFLALNPAVAGLLSSLAGLPGLVAGLTAAAGGLGYALGTVVNKTVEWVSGGQSIGTMLYDLVNGSSEAEKAITRTATAEELAAAAAQRHARELAAKEEAERKAAEAAAATIKAQEDKIAKNAEETETITRLKAKYAEMGLVWDQVTGEITHQNELSAEQKRAAQELGTALDKLGVDAGVMANRMTQAGEDLLKQLNGIASNAQATSKEVNAAILAMIPKLDTQAELTALRQKIEELGKSGKLTGDQVANAMAMIQDRTKNLVKDKAFDALVDRLAKAREETDRGTEAMDRWQTKATAQTQAALALAKARGDEAAAAKVAAQAAEEEVTFAKERIEQLRAQKAEMEDHVRRLIQQAVADGKVTDAEREIIEALHDKSAAIDVDIAKLTAHLPIQEHEARQAEIMAGPIGQLTRLYAEQTKEHQR
ncbi:MAG: phage tail tape measure protein, partial [Candidatus Competibacter denitrificans]